MIVEYEQENHLHLIFMISLGLACIFLSVYCLYAVAKKVEFTKDTIMLYLAAHTTLSKILSGILAILGIWLLTFEVGTVNAIIAGTVAWLTVASLILLFAPFRKVNLLFVGLFIGLFSILEFAI
ncbi:MAG: hypothetical protein AAF694_28515 [Bacteroidota bacterium]